MALMVDQWRVARVNNQVIVNAWQVEIAFELCGGADAPGLGGAPAFLFDGMAAPQAHRARDGAALAMVSPAGGVQKEGATSRPRP